MPTPPIPNNSAITEAMLTDYQSRYGVDRTRAMTDLNDIEEGRALPPANLPEATYADVLASFRGRDAASSNPRRIGLGTVAIGLVSALVAVGLVINGNADISGTMTSAKATVSGSVTAGSIVSPIYSSDATSTFKVNTVARMLLTGAPATSTLDLASLDSCLALKGSGVTTYYRIDGTGTLASSTTPCPTSP